MGQVEGDSLPEQERAGRAWAAAHGHMVAEVYSDPGLSGRLSVAERPGLAAALAALADGSITGLMVRDLDRLAREVTVQEAVLAQAWAMPGARVFTLHGEVLRDDPDDPMRTAMRQMVGVFAGLDRATVVLRLRNGRRAKAARGEHAVGPAPYGWATVNGELLPIPVELAVLDRMLALRSSGMKQADIAAALNAEGKVAKNGGAWTQPVVSRVLGRQLALTTAQRSYRTAQLGQVA